MTTTAATLTSHTRTLVLGMGIGLFLGFGVFSLNKKVFFPNHYTPEIAGSTASSQTAKPNTSSAPSSAPQAVPKSAPAQNTQPLAQDSSQAGTQAQQNTATSTSQNPSAQGAATPSTNSPSGSAAIPVVCSDELKNAYKATQTANRSAENTYHAAVMSKIGSQQDNNSNSESSANKKSDALEKESDRHASKLQQIDNEYTEELRQLGC